MKVPVEYLEHSEETPELSYLSSGTKLAFKGYSKPTQRLKRNFMDKAGQKVQTSS